MGKVYPFWLIKLYRNESLELIMNIEGVRLGNSSAKMNVFLFWFTITFLNRYKISGKKPVFWCCIGFMLQDFDSGEGFFYDKTAEAVPMSEPIPTGS